MSHPQPHSAPPRNALATARAEARRAYEHAKRNAGMFGLVLDRLWSETLLAVDGARVANRIEMFRRTRMLFDLLADRQT